MTYHSKSVVGFGQLLNVLGAAAGRRMPLPAMLDIVKQHFAADAVLLAHVDSRGRSRLAADSANADLAEDQGVPSAPGGRPAPPRAWLESRPHVTAREPRADGSGDCSIWIFRDPAAPRFDDEEAALAGIVNAHVARALEFAARLDRSTMENALYCDALESLHVGMVIADESGRVLRMSRLAESLLAAGDGLQIQAGRLRAGSVTEDRELQALVRAAARGEEARGRGLSLTRRSGLRTLGLVVRRVAADQPMACIYLRDFDAEPRFESEIVRQILDLTPAEAAMTRRLAAGQSLEDTALALDISRNTARAHLRSIFSKNGISRQTELVRVVLNSAALLGSASGEAGAPAGRAVA